MLCEQCGANEATVHLTSFVDGQMQQKHICTACAGKMNISGIFNAFSVNDLFDGFISVPATKPVYDVSPKCEQCGMTLDEFKDSGKLGCANCYKTFESCLMPIIKKVQGGTEHMGKAPEGNLLYAKRREVDNLREKLNDAVRVEDYETAAELRDKIKDLEKEGV